MPHSEPSIEHVRALQQRAAAAAQARAGAEANRATAQASLDEVLASAGAPDIATLETMVATARDQALAALAAAEQALA